MQKSYHTISTQGQTNSKRLAEFFSRHGQGLLPMVDLIEQSRLAVDELIDMAGRATIEAVLQLSAAQVAGPRTPGQRRTGLLWHGRQVKPLVEWFHSLKSMYSWKCVRIQEAAFAVSLGEKTIAEKMQHSMIVAKSPLCSLTSIEG